MFAKTPKSPKGDLENLRIFSIVRQLKGVDQKICNSVISNEVRNLNPNRRPYGTN
jgi:hypothetical protein